MKLTYPWVIEKNIWNLNVDVFQLHFSVLEREHYETKDSSTKANFHHPWHNWRGVDISYSIKVPNSESNLTIVGSRGKTIWYLPATTNDHAQALRIQKGHALKIVKYNVKQDLAQEFDRLNYEIDIQNHISSFGYAPRSSGVIGVVNLSENEVEWFEHTIYYPACSFFLATIVEHIIAEPFPPDLVRLGTEDLLCGPLIDDLTDKCLAANIAPYDLCLGNVLFSGGHLKVVDFHKWTKK